MSSLDPNQLRRYLSSPLAKFRPWILDGKSPQQEFLRAAATHRTRIFRAGNRAGKMQPITEPVLTPKGFIPIGHIKVGDTVFAKDGSPTLVTNVFPQSSQAVYEINFNDFTSTRCGLDHLWLCKTPEDRRTNKEQWRTLSLRTILNNWGAKPKLNARVAIPFTDPIQFSHKELPIDPYTLGFILTKGERLRNSTILTIKDPKLLAGIAHNPKKLLQKHIYRISAPNHTSIPALYKISSSEQRFALLQGILDSSASQTQTNTYTIRLPNLQLAKDTQDLLRSLGLRSKKIRKKKDQHKDCYIIGAYPFSSTSLNLRFKHHKLISQITRFAPQEQVCITVEHPSQTYITKDYIVTHNSTVGAFDLALHLTGWHPFTKFPNQPVHWWASAVSFRDGIGTVVWPALKQFLPPSEIKEINWYQKASPETPHSVTMKNGSTLIFKSVEQTRVKYQGAKLNGLWLDEDHPRNIVDECRARVLDVGGYLNITLTPLRREKWVTEIEKETSTFLVTASTIDAAKAGVINLEATLQFAANLPEKQRLVRIYGEHVSNEGSVWPEFSRETHVLVRRGDRLYQRDEDLFPWPLPDSWRRFAAIDFGYNNPTAILMAAEDPFHKRLIIYRNYYARALRASEWAMRMHDKLCILSSPAWADHDSFARAEFENQGIPTLPAKKSNVNTGLEAVSRALMKKCGDDLPQLLLVSNPEDIDPYFGRVDTKILQDEIENYHYIQHSDSKSNKDQPVKVNDHACLAPHTRVWIKNRGLTRIDQIQTTAEILTPTGYKHFEGFRKTRENADTIILCFDDHEITCTPDHLWLSSEGDWVEAQYLQDPERYMLLPKKISLVKKKGPKLDVWCCSLENGFLVEGGLVSHNCDALRYLIMGWEGSNLEPPLPPNTESSLSWRQNTDLSLAWPEEEEDDY